MMGGVKKLLTWIIEETKAVELGFEEMAKMGTFCVLCGIGENGI